MIVKIVLAVLNYVAGLDISLKTAKTLPQWVHCLLIGNIYCFGTGLLISVCKDVSQYYHFMYNYKLTLQIFDINPKSEEILNFYVVYL